jgi:hypothetical protein
MPVHRKKSRNLRIVCSSCNLHASLRYSNNVQYEFTQVMVRKALFFKDNVSYARRIGGKIYWDFQKKHEKRQTFRLAPLNQC